MPTKTSSGPAPPLLRDRTTARHCLLALPGLGTFLAGRRFAGIGQALLALTGFALTGWWFVSFLVTWLRTRSFPWDSGPRFRLGNTGVVLFLVSWLWALVTSLAILRRSRPHL